METTAWASMLKTETNDSTLYRIRFNRLTSKLLDGIEWVYVTKTEKYLVFTPVDNPEIKASHMVHVSHKFDSGHNIAEISMNRIVLHEGIVSRSFFGKMMRYKVKRGKDGKVFIGLTEVAQ